MIPQNVTHTNNSQVPNKNTQDKSVYGYVYGPTTANMSNSQVQNYNMKLQPKPFPEQKIPLHVMTTSSNQQEKSYIERNPIYPRKRSYNFIDFNYATLNSINRNYDGKTINNKVNNKYVPVRIYPYSSTFCQAIPIYYQVKETCGNGVKPFLIKKAEQPIKKPKIESTEVDNILSQQSLSSLSALKPILEQQQQLPPLSPLSQVTSQSFNSETNTEAEDDGEYADGETEQEDYNNDENSNRILMNDDKDGQLSEQELLFFEHLHSCVTLDEWTEIMQIFNLFNIDVYIYIIIIIEEY